jgi:GAF domain-containing protein
MENRIAAIYELGQKLVLLNEPQEIVEAVLEITDRVFDIQDCNFFLMDNKRKELFAAARCSKFQGMKNLHLPLDGEKGIIITVARSLQAVYIPDTRLDSRYRSTDFPALSELAIPVQIKDIVLGVIHLTSSQPDAFDQKSQELLSILSNQAALSLENARLHAEEQRRAQEITLVNCIAQKVNANLDLQVTLDAIVETVFEYIPCFLAEISLWDQKQGMLVLQALRSKQESTFQIGQVYPPGKGFTGWLVRHKRPLLVPDVVAHDDIVPDFLPEELPFQSYLGLPLLIGEELIGTLVLVNDQVKSFDEQDLCLLESLSEQVVGAIQNARFYKELNGLYAEIQQKANKLIALNAVSAAINQPLPLQAIMEQAIEKVIEVMKTDAGGIRLLNQETGELPIVASRGLSPEHVQATRLIHMGEGVVGAVAQSGEPQVIKDVRLDPRVFSLSAMIREGFITFAVVPLRSKDTIVGTLGVVTRQHRDFPPEDIELLTAIGDQIGVAVENSRLYTDLARYVRQLEAVQAVAEVVNRTEELDKILNEGLKQILAVTGLEMGAIALAHSEEQAFSVEASQGMSKSYISWLEEKLKSKPLKPDTWASGFKLQIEKTVLIDPQTPHPGSKGGVQLHAEIPLFAESKLVGLLVIATHQPHSFTDDEKALLQAVGHQLGIAIADARLRQGVLEAEKMAAIGRVAASVAHDLRSPLGGILRSAEFLARPELTFETRQKLSKSIVSLVRRLINTSQQILDYVKNEHLTLKCTSLRLTDFLDEVLSVLEIDFSDQGIELDKMLNYQGEVWLDGDYMAQVVYNIASNARDAMPKGGKFRVSTCQVEDWVELVFSDTGPGVPQELGEHIFTPFFSYGKRKGAGLGLAIVKKIIEEHKGNICLKDVQGWGATFVITLPL